MVLDLDEYAALYETERIYPDLMTSPEVLAVGDVLFPLLYIYFMGNEDEAKKVGRPDMFERDIRKLFTDLCQRDGKDPEKELEQFKINCPKYARMLTSALQKNRTFAYQLNNSASELMSTYRARYKNNPPHPQSEAAKNVAAAGGIWAKKMAEARKKAKPALPIDKYENKSKALYSDRNRKKFSYQPILDPDDPANMFNIMETLRILYENDVIDYRWETGCRPISLKNGDFADTQALTLAEENKARLLGLPVKGLFTVDGSTKANWMYHTFTGSDIIAMVSLGDKITRLEGMTGISWSVHRGKTTQRPLGRPGSSGRATGTRTIAGSLIFAISDHNPLLDILPDTLPLDKAGTANQDKSPWKTLMMPDQIPPFDIMITMLNEYGKASVFTLYGVEISDEGGVISTDNMIIETTFQYTAVAMDPIVQAEADESGYVDPYGILKGGFSQFWKQREAAIEGVLHSDLQESFHDQYEAFDQAFEMNRKLREQYKREKAKEEEAKKKQAEEEGRMQAPISQ